MIKERKTILFIEDDKNNATIVSQTLTMYGYEVLIANNVSEAWYIFLKKINIIDGIILDIILEIGDVNIYKELTHIDDVRIAGVLLYQLIRRKSPNLPIIIRTSELTTEIQNSFKGEKNIVFFEKGVSQKLVEIVNSFLKVTQADEKNIFIIHGSDELTKFELKNYLQSTLKIGEPIILHEQPSLCRSIFEKFEHFASRIDIVFVLLTPDDLMYTSDKSKVFRARQNVIFEMGYFLGMLRNDRKKVIILYKNVEIPSDISGLIYIDISKGVESASELIRRELDSLIID